MKQTKSNFNLATGFSCCPFPFLPFVFSFLGVLVPPFPLPAIISTYPGNPLPFSPPSKIENNLWPKVLVVDAIEDEWGVEGVLAIALRLPDEEKAEASDDDEFEREREEVIARTVLILWT